MIYKEFQLRVRKAGLTQKAFAELLQMNPRSLSNHSPEEVVATHLAVIAALLEKMAVSNIDYRSVFMQIDLVPKKPRGKSRGSKISPRKQVGRPEQEKVPNSQRGWHRKRDAQGEPV